MHCIIRTGTRIGLSTLLLAGAVSLQADTIHYRWTNEKGGTEYSDRPPPEGVDYEVVSSDTGLRRLVDGDEGAVPLEVQPTPSNEFEQVDDRSVPTAARNEVLCEKARMNLIALEKEQVINTRNEKGEVREMTGEEREILKQTSEAHVKVYCP